MSPFVGDEIDRAALDAICADAYATFHHPAVCPLVQLGPDEWLLELFHGPTLAFKDVALQLVGRLFDHVLAQRGERVTIVGATSRRHRLGGHRRRGRARPTSTSSSSTPRAG